MPRRRLALPSSVSLPFTSFPATAFARLPSVSFVTPDLCHDMHDCGVAVGDAWLRAHIGPYTDWAMQHNGLLILTWDEDDGSQANHITTIFAGQMVRLAAMPNPSPTTPSWPPSGPHTRYHATPGLPLWCRSLISGCR